MCYFAHAVLTRAENYRHRRYLWWQYSDRKSFGLIGDGTRHEQWEEEWSSPRQALHLQKCGLRRRQLWARCVIVYRWTRFSRNHLKTSKAAQRMRCADHPKRNVFATNNHVGDPPEESSKVLRHRCDTQEHSDAEQRLAQSDKYSHGPRIMRIPARPSTLRL